MDRPFSQQLPLMAAAALGVSTTVFLDYLAFLISPTHMLVYHLSGRPSVVFISTIADILLLAAACLAALLYANERAGLHRVLWSGLLCMFPWVFVKHFCTVADLHESHHASVAIFAICVTAFLFLILVRSAAADRLFGRIQEFGMMVFVAAGVVGALALIETTWFAVEARHLNDQTVADTIARPANAVPHGRVLWIILDELAYRQLYEERLPGLQLPAFDQFRAESTVFSNVEPAGIRTEIVLPALMTGDAVDHIESAPDGRLSIHDQRGWHPFDQRNTVFADADALGYRSSVVGWFNPYCRILPSVLDSCFWVNHSLLDDFSTNRSIPQDLLTPVETLFEKLPMFLGLTKTPSYDLQKGKEHIRDYVELDRAADAALSDSRNTFVFLHMPVPHPEGIWDRRTGQFAVDRSCYVDNLALADDYLAHVRRLLEATGQWESTTVVIMGDHAWRTQLLWKGSPGWNRDDQLASDGGRFDPRPAYLVKLPYQHTADTVATSFAAVRTRPLLDQLLQGRITSPAQLQQWVARGQASPVSAQTPRATQPRKGDHS
jgi:hypothetical protein